ncbi:MAG: hypothetical protein EZS28_008052 [Streblomastix strix]|uniref:Uncharacterized protein n=1 Tax=Streblomastix strix TaxID=222440 RepID=A0A5J4WN66_9EUKA|nr:MAG: hypothetical protein EZS28_008052 [Streblomastix strix]
MYIADVNGLLGIKICPICKVHAIPAHDKYNHVKRKMDAHMKKCKENQRLLSENIHIKLQFDGQIVKRVVLEKYPKPYAPHVLSNKSYKTVNFVDEWFKQLFEEAKQVKFDNKYNDENIPQCFDVPVLGWDSSKFDTSLIFRNLHSNQYVISKYIGSGSHPKQNVVRNTKNSITLKFIDAKSYLAPNMEYETFVKDIGKTLKNSSISIDQYNNYISRNEVAAIVDGTLQSNYFVNTCNQYDTRWDYMRNCIEQDTKMMLHPIDNMINFYFEFKIIYAWIFA